MFFWFLSYFLPFFLPSSILGHLKTVRTPLLIRIVDEVHLYKHKTEIKQCDHWLRTCVCFFFTVKNSGYSSFHRTTIQSCVYVCVIKQKHIERKCRCPLVRKKTAGYLGISLPCFPLLPIRFPLCCSSISPSLFSPLSSHPCLPCQRNILSCCSCQHTESPKERQTCQ